MHSMNVALVFPPFYLEPMYNMPPLGLIHLAASLGGTTHRPVIIDLPLAIRLNTLKMGKNIYADCARKVIREDPDVVGFSVQCTTFPPSVQISKEIKRLNPEVRIVFGGHAVSSMDERTLQRFPWIDAVVRGEGEITFPRLISALDGRTGLDEVAGITFRREDLVIRNADRELVRNLDDLPPVDHGLVPSLQVYRDACSLRRSIAIVEVGRGCPHNCVYCSQSVIWQRRSRVYSIDRIIREMRNLHESHGAECFLLAYDQFTARRAFVEEFCTALLDEGLHRVPWYCISRLDSVDAPLLELMRRAGCESMCYGIDSGSRKTLAFIRKNIDHEILFQRVMETTAQGIVPTLSFVIGFPVEEKEDIDATLELALKTGIPGGINPLLQLTTILPGTDLQRDYAHLLVREVDTYFSLGIEFDNGRRISSDEDLIGADSLLFSSFYNLPCPAMPLAELNLLACCFPILVNFYPRSFLLLTRELELSPSDLFFLWISWLKERTGMNSTGFSPQDCYLHFSAFSDSILSETVQVRRSHLRDVMKYETLCLEAGKFDVSGTHFLIDLNDVQHFRPVRNSKVITGEFLHDMPRIVRDMKKGRLDETYPDARTFLFFRQEKDRLDVKEINEYGFDFLALCDGSRTVRAICRSLYDRHGNDCSYSEFERNCVQAVLTLGEMKLIRRNRPNLTEKGGGTDADG